MKTPSKIFALLFSALLTVGLSACGGEEKTAPKTEPKPAQTTKADAPSTQEPKPQESKSQEPKPQETQEPLSSPAKSEPKPEEKPAPTADSKSEPKADTVKSDVKPLSVAEGKARYEKTCKVCHDQGLLDAPKLTAKADWAKRLDKGMDTLYTHSAKGFGKMPAQATGEVSEAEVYSAVDYMVSQVK